MYFFNCFVLECCYWASPNIAPLPTAPAAASVVVATIAALHTIEAAGTAH